MCLMRVHWLVLTMADFVVDHLQGIVMGLVVTGWVGRGEFVQENQVDLQRYQGQLALNLTSLHHSVHS